MMRLYYIFLTRVHHLNMCVNVRSVMKDLVVPRVLSIGEL
jgi:hypothetical protein